MTSVTIMKSNSIILLIESYIVSGYTHACARIQIALHIIAGRIQIAGDAPFSVMQLHQDSLAHAVGDGSSGATRSFRALLQHS